MSCTVCNDSKEESTKALGHNYKQSKVITQATCTSDGEVTMTCSRCKDSYNETKKATGHNWLYATCTKPTRCNICGITNEEALGHSWQYGRNTCVRCSEPASATIILEDGSRTFSYYMGGTSKYSTCELTKISIDLGKVGSTGLIYNINYEGTCIYASKNQVAVSFAYRVYDSDGFIVHEGSTYTSSLREGDKFRDDAIIQYRFTPGETYTIVLSDYCS